MHDAIQTGKVIALWVFHAFENEDSLQSEIQIHLFSFAGHCRQK